MMTFPFRLLLTAVVLALIIVILGLSVGPEYKPIFDILVPSSSVFGLLCLVYFIWKVK